MQTIYKAFEDITTEEIKSIIGNSEMFIVSTYIDTSPIKGDSSEAWEDTIAVELFDSENDYIIWTKTGAGRKIHKNISLNTYLKFKRNQKIKKLLSDDE